jgi:Methylamine utilisation protein MauE
MGVDMVKASRLIQWFIYSAAVILLITAAAKLVSSFGAQPVLAAGAPVFPVSYRALFRIVGSLEVGVALVCLLNKRTRLQVELIGLLAACFAAYRFGLYFFHYNMPCGCLGYVTDSLHISPYRADSIMLFVLGYLLIGSSTILGWFWLNDRRNATMPSYTSG